MVEFCVMRVGMVGCYGAGVRMLGWAPSLGQLLFKPMLALQDVELIKLFGTKLLGGTLSSLKAHRLRPIESSSFVVV